MVCEFPGCQDVATVQLPFSGVVHGLHVDRIVHVCDKHRSQRPRAAYNVSEPQLVNPFLDAQRIRRTGS